MVVRFINRILTSLDCPPRCFILFGGLCLVTRRVKQKLPSRGYFIETVTKHPSVRGVYHIAGLNLQLECVGYIWNGDANFLAIKRISQTYRETVRGVSFGMVCTARAVTGLKPMYLGLVAGQLTNAPQFSGMYLRGGLSYTITKTFDYPVNYSKLDTEVTMKDDVNADWEVRWAVKPYSLAQAEVALGKTLEEKRLAYSHDNDIRYTAKV